MKKKEKNLDFNEINERLAAGYYVHSGQIKRYLKSIMKDKKRVILSCIINIVICASSTASKLPKTPEKPCYSLVDDLHGMQGVSGSSPLGSIIIFATDNNFCE